MKKILVILCSVGLVIGVFGTAHSTVMFMDDFENGAYYTYSGATGILDIYATSIYRPYDESGPISGSGAGTEISWHFSVDIQPPVLTQTWDESWSSGIRWRTGDFDEFTYTNIGVDSDGNSVGEFYGVISSVAAASHPSYLNLGPPGPWYTYGRITRLAYDGSGDNYRSKGSVEGLIGNVQVPEPATLILLGMGLVSLAGFGRKKFLKK